MEPFIQNSAEEMNISETSIKTLYFFPIPSLSIEAALISFYKLKSLTLELKNAVAKQVQLHPLSIRDTLHRASEKKVVGYRRNN